MQYGSIPTLYGGVQYRSLLEARWACFLSIGGLRGVGLVEYEPFELCGWIPDFLLRVADRSVVADVKPVSTREEARTMMTKIELALGLPGPGGHGLDKWDIAWANCPYEAMILGVNPTAVWHLQDPWGWQPIDCSTVNQEKWSRARNTVQWRSPSLGVEFNPAP